MKDLISLRGNTNLKVFSGKFVCQEVDQRVDSVRRVPLVPQLVGRLPLAVPLAALPLLARAGAALALLGGGVGLRVLGRPVVDRVDPGDITQYNT